MDVHNVYNRLQVTAVPTSEVEAMLKPVLRAEGRLVLLSPVIVKFLLRFIVHIDLNNVPLFVFFFFFRLCGMWSFLLLF